MNIFIYSDESGVFDEKHNDYFVFGGMICFGKYKKDIETRKYSHVEKIIRESKGYDKTTELKSCILSNRDKGKLYRSLNNTYKFCVLIKQKKVNKDIFTHKKSKQRFLDYAYKMVLKKAFETLITENVLNPNDVENIYVFADEHTTATDGRYELRESLLNEFKYGTFSSGYRIYFPPIFTNLQNVNVVFCNSSKNYLIRASDVIANHYYNKALSNNGTLKNEKNTFVYELPSGRIISKGIEFFSNELQTV